MPPDNDVVPDAGDSLVGLLRRHSALLDEIDRVLLDELTRVGLASARAQWLETGQARFEVRPSPVDGRAALCGEWLDANGHKRGEITVHADGICHAEQDLLCVLPADAECFVEAVAAWGRAGGLQAESRLLSYAADSFGQPLLRRPRKRL